MLNKNLNFFFKFKILFVKTLTYRELQGKKIAEARKEKGLTQPQMAELLGKELNRSYGLRQYHKLEKGNFPKFKNDVLLAVNNILGLNINLNKIEKNETFINSESVNDFVVNEFEVASMSKQELIALLIKTKEEQKTKERLIGDFYDREIYKLLLEIESLKNQLKESTTKKA